MVLLGARSGQSLRSQGYSYVGIREQCLGTQNGVPRKLGVRELWGTEPRVRMPRYGNPGNSAQ